MSTAHGVPSRLNIPAVNITARRIGLISDTHDLVRPTVLDYMHGCDHIIHAGDLCNAAVLQQLSAIAPVTAVRGNNDRGPWAQCLQEIQLLKVAEVLVLVIHDLAQLKGRALPAGVRVVVSGHSHKPVVKDSEGVLFVNPGSAGPRRFKLPISLGELLLARRSVEVRLVQI
jgi:putative phosphoesterase